MLRYIKFRFVLFLAISTFSIVEFAKANESDSNQQSISVITPEKKVEKAKSAKIDTENFEVGFFLGTLSVEDFGTNPTYGITATYHIAPEYFTQLTTGSSDVGRATFEDVVGQDFLSDDDEIFNYTQVSFGYQLFHGRSFLGDKSKFNSHIYLTAGLENIEFAGESNLGFVIGSSYKIVATDWLTWNFDLKDHIFQRDFLSDKKVTNNIEFSIGFNALF